MTWCYLPDTVCPSVRAAVALTWALDLPSRALPPPASSRSRTTPEPSSPPPRQPDIFTLHQSGMILNASPAGLGVAYATPFLPDTPVSRSVLQDSARAKTTPATCGPMSPGSSAKSTPSGSSLKTFRGTSPLALKPCCEPYGTWAGRLRLAYSRRAKSARAMKGFGSSSWPTATAHSFAQTAEDPTPAQTGGTSLAGAAELQWGTPRASDGEKGGPNQAFGAGGTPLPAQAAHWPTPAAQNVKGSSEGSITRADGKSRMDILHYLAEQGFSRPAHLTAPHGPTLSQLRPIWRPLRAWLIASHGRAVWRRLWASRTKARLNPVFVEWLMGWPPGHANCACLATAWCLWQQDMRGALSALPTASGAWIWGPSGPEAGRPMQGDLFAQVAA